MAVSLDRLESLLGEAILDGQEQAVGGLAGHDTRQQTDLEAELERTKETLYGFYSPKKDKGEDELREIVVLDGLRHRIDPGFAKDAKALAQALKLPFELSAQLLWQGIAQAKDFGRSPAETAAALWHAYRISLARVWSSLLRYHQTGLDIGQNSSLSFSDLKESDFFTNGLLNALQILTDEAQTNWAAMGLDLFQEDIVPLIEEERQLVGTLILEYVASIPLSLVQTEALITHVSKSELTSSSDRYTISAILAIPGCWMRHHSISPKLVHETITRVQDAMRAEWTVPTAKAACNLSWAILYHDLYSTLSDLESDDLPSYEDLEALALNCIREDAIVFWNGFLIMPAKKTASRLVYQRDGFCYPDDSAHLAKDDPVGRVQDPEAALRILEVCRERLLALVVRLNSVLRKIRVYEEDTSIGDGLYMSSDVKQEDDSHIRTDLADILLALANLHRKQPESGLDFWEVNGDEYHQQALYGFLRWATDCTTPEVVCATYDLLSSLGAGERCAFGVYQFLAGLGGQVSVAEDDPLGLRQSGGTCSWLHILQVFDYYRTAFSQAQQDYQAAISPADEKLLVAMLKVVEEVALWDEMARYTLWSNTQYPLKESLLSLVRSNVSLDLKAAILDALSSFALEVRHVSEDQRKNVVVDLIKQIIPTVLPVSNAFQPGLQGIALELEEVETTYQNYSYTLAFIRLLTRVIGDIVRDSSSTGLSLGIYDFVCRQVFDMLQDRRYAMPEQQWMLTEACLRFYLSILQAHDPSERTGSSAHNDLRTRMSVDRGIQRTIIAILQIGPDTLQLLKEDLYMVACLTLSMNLLEVLVNTQDSRQVNGNTLYDIITTDETLMTNPSTIVNIHLHISPTSPVALLRAAATLLTTMYSHSASERRTLAQARAFASKVVRILSNSTKLSRICSSFTSALSSALLNEGMSDRDEPNHTDATGILMLRMLIAAFNLEPEKSNVTKTLLSLDGDGLDSIVKLVQLLDSLLPGSHAQMELYRLMLSLARSSSCKAKVLGSLRSGKTLERHLEDVHLLKAIPDVVIDRARFVGQLLDLYALEVFDLHAMGLTSQQKYLVSNFFIGAASNTGTGATSWLLTPVASTLAVMIEQTEQAQEARDASQERLRACNKDQFTISVNDEGIAQVAEVPSAKNLSLTEGVSTNEILTQLRMEVERYNSSSKLLLSAANAFNSWTNMLDVCFRIGSMDEKAPEHIEGLMNIALQLIAFAGLCDNVGQAAATSVISIFDRLRTSQISHTTTLTKSKTFQRTTRLLCQTIVRRETPRATRAYLHIALIAVLSIQQDDVANVTHRDVLELIPLLAKDAFSGFDLCNLAALGLLDVVMSSKNQDLGNVVFSCLARDGYMNAMNNAITALKAKLDISGLYFFSALLTVISRLSQLESGAKGLYDAGIVTNILKTVFREDDLLVQRQADQDYELIVLCQSAALKIMATYLNCGSQLPAEPDLGLVYLTSNQNVIMTPFRTEIENGITDISSNMATDLATIFSFLASICKCGPKLSHQIFKEYRNVFTGILVLTLNTTRVTEEQGKLYLAAFSYLLALSKTGEIFTPVLSTNFHRKDANHMNAGQLSIGLVAKTLNRAGNHILRNLEQTGLVKKTAILVGTLEEGSVLLLAHLQYSMQSVNGQTAFGIGQDMNTNTEKDNFAGRAWEVLKEVAQIIRQIHAHIMSRKFDPISLEKRNDSAGEAQRMIEPKIDGSTLALTMSIWRSIESTLQSTS